MCLCCSLPNPAFYIYAAISSAPLVGAQKLSLWTSTKQLKEEEHGQKAARQPAVAEGRGLYMAIKR